MAASLVIRFILLEGAYWGFYASFLGYATTLLLESGISSTAISLLVALFMLFSFLGSLFWGSVCDRLQSNKKIVLSALPVSALLISLFYRFAGNAVWIAFLYSLVGFVIQPLSTNIDAWLIRSSREAPHAYGQIRSLGSLWYAVTVLAVGQIIRLWGYGVMLAGGLVFLAVAWVAAAGLPDAPKAPQTETEKLSLKAVKDIFSSRGYLFLILILFFNSLAGAPVNSLKVVLLKNVGGNVSHVGLDSFIGVMIQVPLIAAAWRIQRLPLRLRYLIIALAPMLMLLSNFFAASASMVILGTCFTNISYGVALPTMREVTENSVTRKNRNLGHNLSDAIYNSLAGVISMMYAGAVIDAWGVRTMLGLCMAIQAIPLSLSVVNWLSSGRKRKGAMPMAGAR